MVIPWRKIRSISDFDWTAVSHMNRYVRPERMPKMLILNMNESDFAELGNTKFSRKALTMSSKMGATGICLLASSASVDYEELKRLVLIHLQ